MSDADAKASRRRSWPPGGVFPGTLRSFLFSQGIHLINDTSSSLAAARTLVERMPEMRAAIAPSNGRTVEQGHHGFGTTISTLPADEVSSVMIRSFPDPDVIFFFVIQETTASASISSICDGDLSRAATLVYKSVIHRMTLCVLTPTIVPIILMESPERYSTRARRLSLSGFPCGVSRVNWNPQCLHL